MLLYILRWHSILVGAYGCEGGPKNPLKGISMKLLVLALNAQFGVSAGRLDCRAAAMACGADPSITETYTCNRPIH